MDNSLFADEDYELWVLLHQAETAMFRARDKELRKYDLSAMWAAVLYIVQVIEYVDLQATPTEISRWLFRRPHGVSTLLRRMEKEELVKLVKDLGQKNLIRVAITEKGYQAYRDSIKRDSIHRIMSSLSEEEHRQLKSWLLKIRDTACEDLRIDLKPLYPLTPKTN